MERPAFTHEKLTEHIYRITDSVDVCCYLIVGRDRACLCDTCWGIGNIREYVETITALPVFVLLTHGHLDHVGGAGFFEEVCMDTADAPVFLEHSDARFRAEHVRMHLGLDPAALCLAPSFSGTLTHVPAGTVYDLGGVHIEALPLKGHTPGSLSPRIPEDGTVIVGDGCDDTVLLFEEYSLSLSEYLRNLLEYWEKIKDCALLLGNHESFVLVPEVIDNVIECCDAAIAGTDAHVPLEYGGHAVFSCCALRGMVRADGRRGNLLYSADKLG